MHPEATDQPILRDLRSFNARRGRLGPELARNLNNSWPSLGIAIPGPGARLSINGFGGWIPDATGRADSHDPIGLTTLFGAERSGLPTVVEIGSGMGTTTFPMAEAAPDINLIAVDVHTRGIAALMRMATDAGLTNLRVGHGDAVVLLRDLLPPASLEGLRIYFPDPWHKARHHKRRLIRPDIAELLAASLKPGGHIHLATDWEEYAEVMVEVLDATPGLSRVELSELPQQRLETKYERRGIRLGHAVTDLAYAKRA